MNSPTPAVELVAVLCVAPNSTYHQMPNARCYDKHRNAMTFKGDRPVVAHPPCRAWSAYTAHQAKPEPGEKELGLACAAWLRTCGGVLEQPAHSRLFAAAGLPLPNESSGALWTIEVDQSWWGTPTAKRTWLCFSHVPRSGVRCPLTLRARGGDHRRWQLLSHAARSATPPAFAAWLLAIAKLSNRD